jgi:hypothetical protein
MGDCKHCGQPAGFLRGVHKECESAFNQGRAQIQAEALTAIQQSGDFAALKDRITSIAGATHIDTAHQQRLMLLAWEQAVDRFLEDGVLDANEESRLAECKRYFLLNDTDLDRNGYLTRTVKAAVLRDLLEGKAPSRVNVDGGVALNLQKNEKIIWAFPNTEYLEDKTRRHYVGRSSGVSVRIAKGVYYRTSTFKGHPVEYTERVSLGRGLLVLTTKHLFFHGPAKSFRIAYPKIVSFEPYSNGIGITKDGANAKMQTFINGDGWFTYNVLANINNL